MPHIWLESKNDYLGIRSEVLRGKKYFLHFLRWHVGHCKHDYLPNQRGFDSFMGYWGGAEVILKIFIPLYILPIFSILIFN